MSDDPHARLDAMWPNAVAPRVPELERDRRDSLAVLGAAWGIALAIAALLALFAAEMLWVVGPLLVFLAVGIYRIIAHRHQADLRQALMPVVCEAIGDIAHAGGHAAMPLGDFATSGMVRSTGNKPDIHDAFRGTWRGVEFAVADVRLRDVKILAGGGSKGTRQRHYFSGLLFRIATPAPVVPRILLRGRALLPFSAPWRGGPMPAGLRRVAVPHPRFGRYLAMWSDDPAAALDVVTPRFADTMVGLAASAGWRRLDAAFAGEDFLLALPHGGRRFRFGALWRPTRMLPQDLHRLVDEIRVVHRLIDVLRGAPQA